MEDVHMYRLSLLAAANSVQRTVGWRANRMAEGMILHQVSAGDQNR